MEGMRGRRRLAAVASDFGIYLDVGCLRVSLILRQILRVTDLTLI